MRSPTRLRGITLVILAGSIVLWWLLIRTFGRGDVYRILGPYACAVSGLSLATAPRALLHDLRPSLRAVLIGLAVGATMTALTYPSFHLARTVYPSLDPQVRALYHDARTTSLTKALCWVTAVLIAEELLFRGAFPRALQHWVPEHAAYAISLLCYALAQLGTGSLIVGLMAAVCGTIWTVQRVLTGSILSAIIAHLIWTPTVILLYPVA